MPTMKTSSTTKPDTVVDRQSREVAPEIFIANRTDTAGNDAGEMSHSVANGGFDSAPRFSFPDNVLSALAEALIIVNLKAKIVYVNRACLVLTGFAREELIGKPIDELFSDESFFGELAFGHLNCKDNITGMEAQCVRREGSPIPVSISASKVLDPDSVDHSVVCIIQDITARKRLEAESRVIAEIMHGVTSTSNLGELLQLIHRSIGKILYAENCFVALYHAESEMLHMEFFVDKYDRAPPPFKVGRGLSAYVFRKGEPMLLTSESVNRLIVKGEVESVGTDSPIWLGVPLRTPAGIIGVLVVQHYEDENAYREQDVEFLSSVGDQIALAIERKRAEDALRVSDERFRLITRATNDAIWDWDLTTNELWWNEGFQKLFGYGLEEVGSDIDSWTKRLHPEDFERVDHDIHQAIQSGQLNWAGEYRFRRKDGTYAFVKDRGYVVYDEGGKPIRMLGSMMDMTERKLAEKQLSLFNEKLQQSNRELQDFAYVASHDLQEPLRKVQAFADRLSSKYASSLEGTGLDYLERMRGAAERMQKLIQDLLTFSRVSTKTQPFVTVNLNAIVSEVLSDLEISIEQTGATVSVEELPAFEADPMQIRQLMQNLIGNALKFRRPDVPPVVKISGRVGVPDLGDDRLIEGSCEIYVEDNGIGFDERYLDRIFTVFQRLHGRSEYDGSGIGLAVCRKIAERHNGFVTAQSIPGSGATFIVTLPIKQFNDDVLSNE